LIPCFPYPDGWLQSTALPSMVFAANVGGASLIGTEMETETGTGTKEGNTSR